MEGAPGVWRLTGQRYELEGNKCPNCRIINFPPRRICSGCGHDSEKAAIATTIAQETLRRLQISYTSGEPLRDFRESPVWAGVVDRIE